MGTKAEVGKAAEEGKRNSSLVRVWETRQGHPVMHTDEEGLGSGHPRASSR